MDEYEYEYEVIEDKNNVKITVTDQNTSNFYNSDNKLEGEYYNKYFLA
jgi:hypothetical protein